MGDKPKMVIAGGAGALGRRLADDAAARGYEVVILTRAPPGTHPTQAALCHRQVRWDGRTVGAWARELDDAIVMNLAGELVDRRPTRHNIELLTRSRVEPTRALVQAAGRCARPPRLWLQMSTMAIYGDAGQQVIDERHPPASRPAQMPGVARPWEDAARNAPAARKVTLRTGLVMAPGTPAFDRLARLTRLGLGGRISSGRQWVSWIHIDDFLGAVHFIIETSDLDGVVHLTAPNPIQNRDMMAALRARLGRPWAPPTPKPLVYLGALFMRTDAALALTGRRGIPTRLRDAGFEFDYPTFPESVSSLVASPDAPVQPASGM